MTRSTASTLASLVLAGFLALACASGVAVTKPEKLKDAVTQYNRHVRWGNVNAAAGYLPSDQRATYKEDRADEELVILSVEVGSVDADYEGGIAKVSVRYEWRETNGITVKKMRQRQLWKYDDERWLLHSRAEIKKKPKRPGARKAPEGDPAPSLNGGVGKEDWADEVVDQKRMERPRNPGRF
jgi:hypothetical protein